MGQYFNFSLADFSFAFLSILLEGLPFLLLGTILSGIIDQFLPSRLLTRLIPRNAYLGALISALLGLVFPMCECGIVPVIRRLMKKGLPPSNAVAYMLGAPVVNPIVAISTYAAFRGQLPLEMTILRIGLAALVATIVGIAVYKMPIQRVIRQDVLATFALTSQNENGTTGLGLRLWNAAAICVGDFLGMTVYFVVGAAVAATFNTAVNQDILLPLAVNDVFAIASMMALASVLSVCSTTDAFIAATFAMFPAIAKLAFLVFGPMIDLKLLFIYSAVFRKRFVVGLAVALFILIGAICLRLRFVI